MTEPLHQPVPAALSPQLLDPLTLPLHGSRLIEASAGTGKTWTIAALMLRLVLGHGVAGSAPPRALVPGEILVMTFTRAATRELSDRIRARLLEAARCFRDETDPADADDFLRQLRAAYPDGPARREAGHRLALAAESMDDAAVHTIDAWCQRMLREHAFDSAQLFDEALEADEAGRRRQAVQDYWRQEVYPLGLGELEAVLALWPDVEALEAQVVSLLNRLDAIEPPVMVPLGTWLNQVDGERRAELAALKAGWVERIEDLRGWFIARLADKDKPFNGNKVQRRYVDSWCDPVRDWAASPGADAIDFSKTARFRLTHEGFADALKPGVRLAPPPVFDDVVALLGQLEQRAPLHQALQRHAAHAIAGRLAALKRRAGRFGYADLSTRLDAALHGPQGEVLAERIRRQFPVALIDEFQDTSPLQFRLFDRIYRSAEDRPETGLLLIGDPKQSIYGFRGADIYSYLRARHATAGRHHALGTNFRSTAALVAAVNHVFAQAERARGEGAFALGRDGPQALPFEPVGARGRAEQLLQDGAAIPALQIAWLPDVLSQRPLRRVLADQAAAQLASWLSSPRTGWAGPDETTPQRRLRPGDVAVLVRDQHEGEAIRRALARRAIPSVYLSEKDSVFASPEAADLLRWLRAVDQPLDATLARAAYGCASWDLPLAELAAHLDDELLWDRRVALLQRLRMVWQRQGVLTLLRQTLHALELPQRWLAGEAERGDLAHGAQGAGQAHDTQGAGQAHDTHGTGKARGAERRLTNLLHLGELLQAASARLEGPAALIRWLAAQLLDGGRDGGSGLGAASAGAAVVGDAEAHVVRLESDAQRVQVVTVHKSKGLEYPVVMLPFAHAVRDVKPAPRLPVEWVDEGTGTRHLDYLHDPLALAQARRERLREDLRLFYVALTRARHALWLGVGLNAPRRKSEPPTSALTWLLMGGTPEDAGALGPALQAWADAQPAISVRPFVLPASNLAWRDVRSWTPLRPVQPYDARFERRWGIGSFSALVRDKAEAGPLAPAPEAVTPIPARALDADRVRAEGSADEWRGAEAAVAAPPDTPAAPQAEAWHRWTRGARAGNLLHDLLEWLADEGFDQVDQPDVAAALRRRCRRALLQVRLSDAADPDQEADALAAWLAGLVRTPLPPLGATLAEVGPMLAEMEFWLPSPSLDPGRLDAICQHHLLPGRPRPALAARTLQGLLMGYADLVFEHDGRWWVMDYKSNALGPDDASYTVEAMNAAMLSHRYELQAALYLLALHRLLRSRLGASYDPAQHLGGAVYVFLRGWRGPAAGCVHLHADPACLAELEAALDGPPDRPAGSGDEPADPPHPDRATA
ncbi:UvrD-helicase domain-containing protein [Leptothrix discophora]|uniref:RecBCD enzyme subunit RecB n=1 Tax=Leptothrix discophora TaxID=89 RepID=A0ABT9G031_LEPDI|nr:UvrD-helicase domain-containing protein [Leptothrix discophora]MDP4299657.1 UvrD-helicase domain-containing protein [Leptothrix discophora]